MGNLEGAFVIKFQGLQMTPQNLYPSPVGDKTVYMENVPVNAPSERRLAQERRTEAIRGTARTGSR